MSAVKVGQISVYLHEPPENTGQVICGHVKCDMSYAAAYRFCTELTKIRETLSAARAVLTDRANAGESSARQGQATSAVEMHLARLLVDLEIFS